MYIVDDDEGMRRVLHTLLSKAGYRASVFSSSSEFLARYDPSLPGCLVLDIRMPEMSGLELQQQLKRMGSMLPVIFITGHADVPMAVQAMKEGAFEFIQKPFRHRQLLDRINHAVKLDSENRSTVVRRSEVQQQVETLTPRERQVMDMIVEGKANKVIAVDLKLSERTVEANRAKVMEKMGARSVAHLVKLHMSLDDES